MNWRARKSCAADLQNWPLVGYRRDLPFARQISQQLNLDDAAPAASIEVNNSALICDLVRLGAGIALVDLFTLLFEIPDGLQVRPVEPATEVTMAVIYARNRPLSRMGKLFVDCLKTVVMRKADDISMTMDLRQGAV